jgi:folate-binding protein YgfZ
MTDSRSTPEPLRTASETGADTAANGGGSTVLELRGADVLPVLHRISTQNLDDLAPGAARVTLFCDFRGRLQHRAVVARGAQGDVWLLREDAPSEPLAAFMDRHVFREDVRIIDRSPEFTLIARPHHPEQPAGVQDVDGGVRAVAAGDGVVLLVVPRTASLAIDAAAEERFRVSIGRARHGHEIVEQFNPFEVGLGGAVHLDKGCFTGQESLMRLVTYESVRRQMVRVEGEGPAPAVPGPVTAGGANAGTLTTAIEEAPGRWIGLAVLKSEFAAGEQALEIGGRALANVEALPMPRAVGRP